MLNILYTKLKIGINILVLDNSSSSSERRTTATSSSWIFAGLKNESLESLENLPPPEALGGGDRGKPRDGAGAVQGHIRGDSRDGEKLDKSWNGQEPGCISIPSVISIFLPGQFAALAVVYILAVE